jgi:hypothetical protein
MSIDCKARAVDDIIEEVLQIIPNTETNLIVEINKFKDTLGNKAPEVLKGSECWTPFIHILNRNIHDIKDDWQIKIRDLLANKNKGFIGK